MNKKYPWNHSLFRKEDKDDAVKCVYAGPDFFAAENRPEASGVYAGPEYSGSSASQPADDAAPSASDPQPAPDVPVPPSAATEPPFPFQPFMATYAGPAMQGPAAGIAVPPSAPKPETGGGRFCPDCGTPAKPDANFCETCGRRLKP